MQLQPGLCNWGVGGLFCRYLWCFRGSADCFVAIRRAFYVVLVFFTLFVALPTHGHRWNTDFVAI